MFDNLPVVVESEDVDPCVVMIAGPGLMAVKDHVVIFGDRPDEFDVLSGVLRCHALEVVDECLLSITDFGIVLDVFISREPLDSFGRAVLVEHHVVEGHGVALVLLGRGCHRSSLVDACRSAVHCGRRGDGFV